MSTMAETSGRGHDFDQLVARQDTLPNLHDT
jgi:hypothetical protein